MSACNHGSGPSDPGSVVLDIGAEIGALVIYTAADQLGAEIEISPVEAGGVTRQHAAVRARNLDDRTIYGVVYSSLAEGDYTIWSDADTALTTVRVRGAKVTQFTWPAH